jgi:cytochrome c peroxidase
MQNRNRCSVLGLLPLLLMTSLVLSACGGGSGGGQPAAAEPEPVQPRPVLITGQESYEVSSFPRHFLVAPRGEEGRFVGQPAVVETDNTGSNEITNAGATLGRVLFYDKRLSIDDTVSCASCHIQAFGFSDAPDKIVSEGVNGGVTRRRSMGLANARFFVGGRAFWDLRAASMEEQALMPIIDPVEMGLPDLDALEQKLAAIDYYPALFEAAFGTTEITRDRVAKALAQFVRSMVSFNSRYDQGRVEQIEEQGLDPVTSFMMPLPNFTDEENRGKEIFLTPIVQGGGQCIGCHATEAFISAVTGPTNNGLDFDAPDFSVLEDQGACEPPEFASDTSLCGKFKVPSLRNVAVRGPFMHDGRFATLAEVIDHYSEGIQAHPNLAEVLEDAEGNPVRLNFSPEDKAALIAFLNTLTDSVFLSDAKFSDPFQ